MASLSSQSIASSYEQLLHVDRDGGGNGTTLVDVKDGDNGTTFALKLAQFHAEIRGTTGTGATGAGKLNLSTAELTVVDNDVLGRIDFLAPLESSGTDAILAGASIWGEAEATFAADNNSTALVFATNTSAVATEKMRIDSSGNVGIGTATSPHGGVGQAKLSIEGTDSNAAGPHVQYTTASDDYPIFQQLNWAHDTISLYFDSFYDGAEKSSDAGSNFRIFKQNDVFKFQYDSGVAQNSTITWNDGLILDTSGNVSIGSATSSDHHSSSNKLIVGNGSACGISIFNGTGLGKLAFARSNANNSDAFDGGINYDGSRNLTFHTNAGAERVRIDSSGNVGIGEDSPDCRLHAKETLDVAYSVDNFTTDANALLKLENASTTDTAFSAIQFRTGDGCDMFIGSMNASGASNDGSFIVANQNSTDIQFLVLDNNSRISLSNNDGNTYNTVFGHKAFTDTSGNALGNVGADYNVAIGHEAMGTTATTSTAERNVALGYLSLRTMIDGDDNTSIGANSATSLRSGINNTIVGSAAFDAAANDESDNTVIGYGAMGASKQDGTASATDREVKQNVAIGTDAMKGGTLASTSHLEANVAIGYQAMDGTGTAGSIESVAIGLAALGGTWGGNCHRNIGIGAYVMDAAMSDAQSNLGMGTGALGALTTGDCNIALGAYADGTYNGAMATTTQNNNCVAIGTAALQLTNHDAADGSVAVGFGALRQLAPSSGSARDAGQTAVGHLALTSTTSGTQNTALGHQGLYSNTTGLNNTALGHKALYTNVDGDNNVAVGSASLYTFEASSDGDGCNTAVGANSGYLVSTGQDNVLIGENAGWINGGVSLTTGSSNTLVGYQAAIGAADATNRTAIGKGAIAQSNNSVTLGNDDVTDIFMGHDKGAAVRADNNAVHCQGVVFPATQSASGGANTLDDYEEGTWTPASAGSGGYSATSFSGNYVKIGKMVYVSGQFTVDGAGTLDSISNFPFTNASILATGTAVESTNQGDFQLVQLDGGATAGRMRQENNESGYVVNDLIRFNVTYMTA